MLDMFLIWKVINYFAPRSFLEIGFFAGQTMGLIYESSKKLGTYVSVDVEYKYKPIFDQVFPNTSILFHEISSADIVFSPDQKFDFIFIDGDHSYEMVCNDIEKCLPLMHEKTILYIDDYNLQGVDLAIRHKILNNRDYVPFLAGDHSIFFHHRSQSKDQFLDVDLQDRSKNFIRYENQILYDTCVLTPELPNVFVDHASVFIDVLRLYDL
jgi:hypothetical protein